MIPLTSSLNVTSEGVEIDVAATHRLTGGVALAECKACGSRVTAAALMSFYGKLSKARLAGTPIFGLFCALPRLTADGEESARAISQNDDSFRYLSANDLVLALRDMQMVVACPIGEDRRATTR